jgi:hypothetical protein
MKKVAVVTVADSKFAPYLALFLDSLAPFRHKLDVIVGGIDFDHCRRVEDEFGAEIYPMAAMRPLTEPKLSVLQYASAKYEKAMLLDCDTIVLEDPCRVFETVEWVGLNPDVHPLETVSHYHYADARSHTVELAQLIGVSAESLRLYSGGIIVVNGKLAEFVSRWEEAIRLLLASPIPLRRIPQYESIKSEAMSDELPLSLFAAQCLESTTLPDVTVLPVTWNYPPLRELDTAQVGEHFYAAGKRIKVMHYCGRLRPVPPGNMTGQDPDHPVFDFWHSRYRRLFPSRP